DLDSNQLTTLPESITQLTNLTQLDLHGNKLTTLPESITQLTNLTRLGLHGNKLTTLPESISQLTNLTRLDLYDNQLTTLPESISQLTNLTRLYLSDNPLETPPIEIAKKGIEAIREYFQQIKAEGTDYLYEAKLLILGEGGAGKTTLANKIQDPNYQLQNEDSTKGIEVHQWNFQTANQYKFQTNIWDFGGQEIYHSTHQFFLTKRSLYILVADTRKEDTDFYYWLNVAELLSDNSPLLIIKNEKQERKREINQRALQGQFSNIKEILATNFATNRGLEKIRTNIQHYISNLPHIGSALPKTWKKVREVLETDSRNYISLEEYLSICEENGFKKREDKLQLSGYLHDLGVFLHFQDDPLLNKTVILKPEWGTAAVYKALDNPKVRDNFGKFTKDDLINIWQESKYANMHDELVQLMINFQLCYKIRTSQTYIAPQLLTENQPAYNWDENNNLILRYTYEFMPKGIIIQFIVAMHEDIEEQEYVWKSGVILKKNRARAEVIEYYGKREIKIRIYGQQKRDLMTIVTHELDKIHSSYNNRLKYNKLIPCNCEVCHNNQNPYFYNFQELKERISHGKYTTECGKPPYHTVKVSSLIDDVIERERSSSFLQPEDSTNPITNHYYGSVINMKDNDFIGNQTIAAKVVNDQSRKIENKDGNVVGNIFGDESNIRDKVTVNSPQQKMEKPKKFGFLDFLSWMQNGQIIFILTSSMIGILLLIIYPQLYPDGLPEWVPFQHIIPVPQMENQSNSSN
ncbi:MAG: COR domain-containing protein, partial [Cyanobacteriota bacterium]|nr:COR domain-containing protein [Cyanobacteriota bacterium]